jgi:hypothetical protein
MGDAKEGSAGNATMTIRRYHPPPRCHLPLPCVQSLRRGLMCVMGVCVLVALQRGQGDMFRQRQKQRFANITD